MAWDYFHFVNAILSPDSGLASSPRLVAVAMARRGEFFFESHATLAKRTGLSRRTVWASLNELAQGGWIKRAGGQRKTGTWVLSTCATIATTDVATIADTVATIAHHVATVANPPVQPLHTKDSEERPLKDPPKEWDVPAWFIPLTTLTGYKRTNHDRAAATILASCKSGGVDVAAMVRDFASGYEVMKHSYGWNDPVAVLKGRPLAIAISKTNRQSTNGHTPVTTPVGPTKYEIDKERYG